MASTEAKSDPIRFGIMGCATIARKLSRAISLSPNATVAAVASRSLEKAVAFAEENNLPPTAMAYGSYDAVLEDPNVDAVYIPLPTSLHLKWAVLAAKKKKHVLLEKPVALNVAELDEILRECESSGVQYMDATMWMHHPRTAKMAELLRDESRLGRIKEIPHLRPAEYKRSRLSRNRRTVNRAYGGVLSGGAVRMQLDSYGGALHQGRCLSVFFKKKETDHQFADIKVESSRLAVTWGSYSRSKALGSFNSRKRSSILRMKHSFRSNSMPGKSVENFEYCNAPRSLRTSNIPHLKFVFSKNQTLLIQETMFHIPGDEGGLYCLGIQSIDGDLGIIRQWCSIGRS